MSPFIYPYSAHALPLSEKETQVGQTILPIKRYESLTKFLAVQETLFVNGAIRFG